MMSNYDMTDLIPIVAELADKYTSKENSSVSYTKAKQLMEAVLYCIHEYEQQKQHDNSSQLEFIVSKPHASVAYRKGYQLVLEKVIHTKTLYETFIMDFHSYGNQNYYDTVVIGIPEFFKYYDARFDPQNHLLTMDYPTLIMPMDTCGIDAIYEYVTYIQLEQLFLNKFPETYVTGVLMSYQNHYEDLFINLCSIVFRNVIGYMLIGKRMDTIGYSNEDYCNLSELALSKSVKELEQELSRQLETFTRLGYEGNASLYAYLNADIPNFSVELRNAAKNNCMHVLFPR